MRGAEFHAAPGLQRAGLTEGDQYVALNQHLHSQAGHLVHESNSAPSRPPADEWEWIQHDSGPGAAAGDLDAYAPFVLSPALHVLVPASSSRPVVSGALCLSCLSLSIHVLLSPAHAALLALFHVQGTEVSAEARSVLMVPWGDLEIEGEEAVYCTDVVASD